MYDYFRLLNPLLASKIPVVYIVAYTSDSEPRVLLFFDNCSAYTKSIASTADQLLPTLTCHLCCNENA